MLVGREVVESMAAAFVQRPGQLVDRLLAVLEAGQAAGGDRRGEQAAALVVSGPAARPGAARGSIGSVTYAWTITLHRSSSFDVS
jgi:uncharacterized Ntn-hydrolase superfamily protein